MIKTGGKRRKIRAKDGKINKLGPSRFSTLPIMAPSPVCMPLKDLTMGSDLYRYISHSVLCVHFICQTSGRLSSPAAHTGSRASHKYTHPHSFLHSTKTCVPARATSMRSSLRFCLSLCTSPLCNTFTSLQSSVLASYLFPSHPWPLSRSPSCVPRHASPLRICVSCCTRARFHRFTHRALDQRSASLLHAPHSSSTVTHCAVLVIPPNRRSHTHAPCTQTQVEELSVALSISLRAVDDPIRRAQLNHRHACFARHPPTAQLRTLFFYDKSGCILSAAVVMEILLFDRSKNRCVLLTSHGLATHSHRRMSGTMILPTTMTPVPTLSG